MIVEADVLRLHREHPGAFNVLEGVRPNDTDELFRKKLTLSERLRAFRNVGCSGGFQTSMRANRSVSILSFMYRIMGENVWDCFSGCFRA